MDIEIIQKYKVGVGGDYTLVYESEGKDDPFNDIPIQNAEELSSEIAINLTGEVTMAATMNDELNKILDSYGNGETVTIAAYVKSSRTYEAATEQVAAADDEEDEEGEEDELPAANG